MRRRHFTTRAVVTAMAALLLLSACGTGDSSGETDTSGGATDGTSATGTEDSGTAGGPIEELTVAIGTDFPDFDPQSGSYLANTVFFDNVGEPLVQGDGETTELYPALAESWELVDDTTWEFKLREGVTFHNGEPFNAEAAKFSIDRMRDPATESAHIGYFEPITDVEVTDEYTIHVKSEGPAPDIPRSMTALMMVPPEHTQSSKEAIGEEPIGTGPYVFDSATQDSITLTRNAEYWNDEVDAQAESVTILSRPEAASRVSALQAGEIDIAWDVPVEQADSVPQTLSAALREIAALRLNGHNGLLTDQRIREAIMLSSDEDAIRTALFTDEYSAPPKCQWAPEGVFGHNPDLENPEYDPEEARRLVEEAGAEGETIVLAAPAGRYPKGEEFVEALALEIEKTGLKVELDIRDYESWLEVLLGEEEGDEVVHNVDAIFVGINSFQGTVLEPFGTIMRAESRLGSFPHDEYPRFQELVLEAEQTLDDDERERLLQEASAVACEARAVDFLYNYDMIWGAREGITWPARSDDRIWFHQVEG